MSCVKNNKTNRRESVAVVQIFDFERAQDNIRFDVTQM